jgi:FixJ family two-component response regulator
MKEGASDFFAEPFEAAAFMAAVERALEESREIRRQAVEQAELLARYRCLTPREQEVLPLLASGLLNKQAAAQLGITECTVQVHRGHIMRKMRAESFATLVRMAERLSGKSQGALMAPFPTPERGLSRLRKKSSGALRGRRGLRRIEL